MLAEDAARLDKQESHRLLLMSLIRKSLLLLIVSGLAACSSAPPQQPEMPVAPPVGSVPPQPPAAVPVAPQPWPAPSASLRPTTFAALPGWDADDLRAAWPAFLASCAALKARPEWASVCFRAQSVGAGSTAAIRRFFEAGFVPYRVVNPDGTVEGMVTGYYEPLLHGARKRGGRYQTPLYGVPADLLAIDVSGPYPELKGQQLRGRLVGNKVVAYPARAELLASGALAGKEILWVDDPIDAFFLQVQGSGRVQLADDNEVVRLSYADQNGWPYKSIGRYLIDKGELTPDQASMQGIKAWAAAHPAQVRALLNANPRYVFFREEKIDDPAVGPTGALGVPLTPERSIAVDPRYVPLGAPVFLATTRPGSAIPMRRLVLAQDTGSAIKGAVRADYFWGFGDQAGDLAGRMKQRGAMWVLLPK